jgi:hypothetical protein
MVGWKDRYTYPYTHANSMVISQTYFLSLVKEDSLNTMNMKNVEKKSNRETLNGLIE